MGLDIYAGTLTRYYSYNWKTVVQQWAEENGFGFQKITPDGEAADNEEEMPPAEVEQVAGEKCQPIGHIGYYYPAYIYRGVQRKPSPFHLRLAVSTAYPVTHYF